MIKTTLTSSFARFAYSGVLSFSLKIGLTALLTEVLFIHYLLSYVITLCIVLIGSYFYHLHITYQVAKHKTKRFAKYVLLIMLFYITDVGLVALFTEILNIHYLLSIFVITASLFVAKFFVFRTVVFNRACPERNKSVY